MTDKCPECGQFITPEASEELQDILEHLEEALVDFKSGENLDRSKASVERYSRKAKMYFSNNPKIKPLLEEVQIEMEIAEKHAKSQARKGIFVSILKNKWVWAVLPIIIGAVTLAIGKEETGYSMGGIALILGGVYGLMFAGGLHKH